jgi:hypothetical protein
MCKLDKKIFLNLNLEIKFDMGRSNKKIFEGMKYTQRACFG